jgi:hypothetical protein
MKSSVSTAPRTNRPALGYLRSVAWDGVRPFSYRSWGGPLLGHGGIQGEPGLWSAAGTPLVGFRYLDPDFGFWRSAAAAQPGAASPQVADRSAPKQTKQPLEPEAPPARRQRAGEDASPRTPSKNKTSAGAVEAAKTRQQAEGVDTRKNAGAIPLPVTAPTEPVVEAGERDVAVPVEPVGLDIPAPLQARNLKWPLGSTQRIESPPPIARPSSVQNETEAQSSKARTTPLSMQSLPAAKERTCAEARQEGPQNRQVAPARSTGDAESILTNLPRLMLPAPSAGVPPIERPWEEIFESLRQSSRPPQAQRSEQPEPSQHAEEPMPRPAVQPPEPVVAPVVRHAIRPRTNSGTNCFWERVYLNQPDLRMFK